MALFSLSLPTFAGGLCSDVFTSRLSLGVSEVATDVHFALLPFSEKKGQTELYAVRDGRATLILKGKQVQNVWKDHEQILRLSGDIFGLAPKVFQTGPMSYLQIYKYNVSKNEMDFFGEIPVREDPVYGNALREIFPLDRNSFIVADSFSSFVSPYREYLGKNPDIQFTVVEVNGTGMTKRTGHFSDSEKIAAGLGQGVQMGGMSQNEIVLFDQNKVRVFRYRSQQFRDEEVLDLNFSQVAGLKHNDLRFSKRSEDSFVITTKNGEEVLFKKFGGTYQRIETTSE